MKRSLLSHTLSFSWAKREVALWACGLFLLLCTNHMCYAVSIQPGWPQDSGGSTGVWSSPALGDLEGDGDLEVVVATSGNGVIAWHHNGLVVAGWPVALPLFLHGSPALADLDKDGDLEVLIGTDIGRIYALHYDGTLVPGWYHNVGFDNDVNSIPAVGDVDRDGNVEVFFPTSWGWFYAYNHDATFLEGWDTPNAGGDTAPILGDLDGDGGMEVILSSGGEVYAWHSDSSLVAGWPQQPTEIGDNSSPALGDIDGDGGLEVVVGTRDILNTENHKVYAWHHDGFPVTGWPIATEGGILASPALGDIDGDQDLEVVVGAQDGNLYAWHGDGSLVAGWPQSPGAIISSPALADLDGDRDVEIVCAAITDVYAWHGDGTLVSGWPRTESTYGIYSSPAIADLDKDGDVEVVIGSYDNYVYAWSCDTYTNDHTPWTTFHRDNLRTGLYQPIAPITPVAEAGFVATPVIGPVPLQVAFTDQSTDNPTFWSWSFGDDATSAEQNPMHEYTSVGRYPVSVEVVTDLGPVSLTKERCIWVLFTDVLTDQWAWQQVMSCVEAGIVQGFPDNTYRPTVIVNRGQMAVYIARALAGGDELVPTGPATASFTDVATDHQYFKYVEYAVEQNVVQGYTSDNTYRPTIELNRAQMAVFIARALCGGEEYVPTGPITATFPDVAPGDFGYNHIEYIADPARDIASGYPDGTYRPLVLCRRDQMAAYVANAFLR